LLIGLRKRLLNLTPCWPNRPQGRVLEPAAAEPVRAQGREPEPEREPERALLERALREPVQRVLALVRPPQQVPALRPPAVSPVWALARSLLWVRAWRLPVRLRSLRATTARAVK
jgi:hypothetical protein